MLSQTIGFIGAGQMARAMARGFVAAGLLAERQIVAADPHQGAIDDFLRALPGASIARRNTDVVAGSEIIVLAVKPQTAPSGTVRNARRDVGRQAGDFDHHRHPIRCALARPWCRPVCARYSQYAVPRRAKCHRVLSWAWRNAKRWRAPGKTAGLPGPGRRASMRNCSTPLPDCRAPDRHTYT